MKEVYVLDACALIAFLNDEKGAEKMEKLLEDAASNKIKIVMAIINLYEVYYDSLRTVGEKIASDLLDDIHKLPIEVERYSSDQLLKEAARFKVNEKISLADSFALGLAKVRDGKLVSTDHHEFDVIEQKGLAKFYWLR